MKSEIGYFKSAFSVDNVIFGFDHNTLKILLIKRKGDPYMNMWALPGDLVYPDENLDSAPRRVLRELTGLENVYLEQVATFGDVDRHPRGRVITIAYYSLVNIKHYNPRASSFAEKVEWIPVRDIKKLAFDHNTILLACLDGLKKSVQLRPIGFELLPDVFTLSMLQSLYEVVLDKKLDKRNFRKKILAMNILKDLEQYQTGVPHRPAKLFKFDQERYQKVKLEGMTFDI